MGVASRVLDLGALPTAQDPAPEPLPATLNAETFKSIATKMDLVERLKEMSEAI